MITQALASRTLSSPTAAITFTNINTSYQDLMLLIRTVGNSDPHFLSLRFNDDSSNSYINTYLFGGNITQSPVYSSHGVLRGYLAGSITSMALANNECNNAIINIFNYKDTAKWKSILVETNDVSRNFYGISSASYQSTNAITSITVTVDSGILGAGTQATLMGVRA